MKFTTTMIWRLAIFFSLVIPYGRLPLSAGTVAGSISLTNSADAAVKRKRDFSNVVVWLTPTDTDTNPPTRSRAQMLQKDKTFSPHILVIPVGTRVDFPNLDPIFHNAFSSFDGQLFDVALYPPGSSRSVQFNRSGIVRVFCNIHPFMSAIIVVVDTPYFTKTNGRGDYTIPAVAPGSYRLQVFHERATPETLEAFTRTIAVTGAPATLDPMTISEAGYLPTPHKNKYGRDYPASADSDKSYSWPNR